MKRRDFMMQGTMAGAAMLLPALTGLAHCGKSAHHREVISGLSLYSRRILPVLGEGEIHLLVSIDSVPEFLDPDQRRRALPFDGIQARGNVLTFTHHDVLYRIENVMPEHFAPRARELGETGHA